MSNGNVFACVVSKDYIDDEIKVNAPILVYRVNPDTLKLDLIKRTNKDGSFVYDCEKKVSNRYGNKMTIVINVPKK